MNKIPVIIKREYLTRIRQKSFIVMTILGPLLFAAMLLLPVWLKSIEGEGVKQIAVMDSSQLFIHKIPETEKIKFTYVADVKLDDFKKNLYKTEFFGILYIPPYITYVPRGTEFFSYKQPPANIVTYISNAIEKEIETEKLKTYNIENLDEILRSIRTPIKIETYKLSESGTAHKTSNATLKMVIAYIGALITFMFIFMFGAQVMRGVIEEKANRIIEVIISSVKPFQLMMGKVIGVALVGLTQFMIWIVFTFILVGIAQVFIFPDFTSEAVKQGAGQAMTMAGQNALLSPEQATEFYSMMHAIDFGVLIGCFLFLFIGGYLLYGSLFAAVGSLVDSDADTQQFSLPITVPLIIALMVLPNIVQNPDSSIAVIFSIIPFTSPVVMMARIPFGMPYWEIAISMILLVFTFIGSIWLSGKIYRTGILVYGKKLSYKELWKWLTYKE